MLARHACDEAADVRGVAAPLEVLVAASLRVRPFRSMDSIWKSSIKKSNSI